MSTATRTLLIIVKQQGLDQVNSAVKGFTTTSNAATKATNGLGTAWQKGQGSVLKLRTGVTNLDKSEIKATKSTDNFSKATDNAGKSTGGLAAKFQGNKGLIFATVGIATAGMEAVGMFQQYQNAAAKVSEATERLNQLERAGITTGQDYTRAQNDLADANRGVQFALRILALSVGDLIPFTLLLINSGVKLKTTLTDVKGAADTASTAATSLGKAANTTSTGGLTGLFNRLGQVVTGTKNYDTGLKTATTTTNTFNTGALKGLDTGFQTANTRVQDATRFIGTGRNGLVGGVSSLTVEMDKSNKMSTKFSDFFKRIGTEIKNLPTTFKNIGSSIANFFTHFGTNIGKLPGLFKAAGVAVMGFGKALIGVFISNPILLVITAISAGILALITNFGGFRDSVNGIGVAIGNAIPQLKGLLQWFGDAANGALDAAAGFLGFDTSAKKAAAAAAEAKLEMDPLLIALQKYIDLGPQFNKLNDIVTVFANVRAEVAKVTETFDFMGKRTVQNLIAVGNSFTTAMATFKDKSPQAQMAIQHVYDTIKLLETGHYDAATSQKFLTTALDAALNSLGTQVQETKKDVIAKQQQEQQNKKTQAATLGLSEEVIALSASWQAQIATGKQVEQTVSANQTAVQKFAANVGLAIPPVDEMTKAEGEFFAELLKVAPLLEDYGHVLVDTANKTVNLGKVANTIKGEHQAFADQTNKDWAQISTLVSQGVEGYKKAVAIVEMLGLIDAERGAALEAILENEIAKREEATKTLSEMIDTALKGSKDKVKAEEQEQTALEKTIEEINKKAAELKITNKIQGLSIQNQQNAIKITEELNKTENTAIFTLQKLAVARGLDISAIEQESDVLLNLILTGKKSTATMDEINARIGELIDTRQEDAKAAEIEEAAQLQLLGTMNKVPPVLGMTGKGLESLVQLYDDTADATGIAADEVGLWYAELKRSQAVETASIEKLLDLAETLKIKIPEGAELTVENLKKIIEAEVGVGDAAKKAAEEAKKAFDDLAGDAASAMEDLIKEDVIAGDLKKVEKLLDDLGKDITDLDAMSAIIDITANTVDFEDDIYSIPELISTVFKGIPPQTRAAADDLMAAYTDGLQQSFGKRSGPVIQKVDALWAQIKADNPQATGQQLIQLFLQAIDQPSLIQGAAQNLGGAIPPGVMQGASGLPGTIAQIIGDGANEIFGAGAQYQKGGYELISQTTAGYTSGSSGLQTAGNTALAKLLATYPPTQEKAKQLAAGIGAKTGEGLASSAGQVAAGADTGIKQPIVQNATLVPTETETALAPLEGIFSQAFLNASVAATQQLNSLITLIQADVIRIHTTAKTWLDKAALEFSTFATNAGTHLTKVNTSVSTTQGKLSSLSTSVSTYMKGMSNAVNSFGTASGIGFGKVTQASDGAHKKLSSMSTSVNTYMKGMTSAVTSFGNAAASSFSKVGSQAAAATTKVKALASAINSLKSKSINIHVGLTGPGAKFMRSGGAFISPEPTGFAAAGKSWINSKPRKIGGVNISEFGKSELVTVTPLSDPSDPMDKGINLGMSVPKPMPIPSTSASSVSTNPFNKGGGQGQPITVRGNLNVTIKTANGQVLAQEVQPYLLEDFSGVT